LRPAGPGFPYPEFRSVGRKAGVSRPATPYRRQCKGTPINRPRPARHGRVASGSVRLPARRNPAPGRTGSRQAGISLPQKTMALRHGGLRPAKTPPDRD